jgi:CRISPR-associated protein Cmr2
MQQYLFQVAIGPVQGFIASARRSRDLWFGSRLLSEVSKIVASTIANKYKDKWESYLIFPAPKSLDELKFGSDLTVANKIIACITIPDNSQESVSENLKQLGKSIEKNIKDKIDEIKGQVYEDISGNKQGDDRLFDVAKADAQIKDLVELSWAAVPYYPEKYNEAREKLDRLMAARKNTRNFRQVAWGSDQLKSSIDGQLEGVINPQFYPQQRESTAEQFGKAQRLYSRFHAGPAERLSGVDLLKRRGIFKGEAQPSAPQKETQLEQDDFLSTSHIASIPYLECLQRLDEATWKTAKGILDRYVKELSPVLYDQLDTLPAKYKLYPILKRDNGKWYDGALFYPERHFDKLIKDQSLKNALQELQQFFNLVKAKLPEATPNAYYAIICADGDYMGKLINTLADNSNDSRQGQPTDALTSNNHETDKGLSRHQRLSRVLDEFSRSVKGIVEQHKGALIYAGGDDVLAFLPLHSVLQCARELADTFSKRFRDEFTKEFADKLKENERPSLSVGIAIVHHLTMLHEALNLGRDAEKLAKGVKGKNALAITANKRSGEQYSVAGRRETLYSTLKEFIDHFRRDYLPRGVAYELRAMQERLTMIGAAEKDNVHKQGGQEESQQKQEGLEQGQKQSDGKKGNIDCLKEIMYLEAKRILRRKLNLPQSRLLSNVAGGEQQKQEKEKILNSLLARIEGAPLPSQNTEGKTASTSSDAGTEQAATTKVPLAEFIQELIVAQELAAAITLAEGKLSPAAQNNNNNKEGNAQ